MTRSIGRSRASTGRMSTRTTNKILFSGLCVLCVLCGEFRAREKQAAAARAEAILLLESFLRESPRTGEAPEALYKLAELYWEDAKVAFLEQMGRYQALTQACQKDRSQCARVPRRAPIIDLARSQGIYERLIRDYPHFRKIDTVL